MDRNFRNRHDWFTLTAAFVVWAAHFSLLWAASSIFPGQPAARWLAFVLTIAAALALVWLYRRANRPSLSSVPGLGLAIAALGVGFGVLPAVFG